MQKSNIHSQKWMHHSRTNPTTAAIPTIYKCNIVRPKRHHAFGSETFILVMHHGVLSFQSARSQTHTQTHLGPAAGSGTVTSSNMYDTNHVVSAATNPLRRSRQHRPVNTCEFRSLRIHHGICDDDGGQLFLHGWWCSAGCAEWMGFQDNIPTTILYIWLNHICSSRVHRFPPPSPIHLATNDTAEQCWRYSTERYQQAELATSCSALRSIRVKKYSFCINFLSNYSRAENDGYTSTATIFLPRVCY